MALWDKVFKKKDEESGRLNPIVQKSPPPSAPVRVSSAKPVPRPAPAPPAAPAPEPPRAQHQTKSRKKKAESETKTRPTDDPALFKPGKLRQPNGDHDGAIGDFTKAIPSNPNL